MKDFHLYFLLTVLMLIVESSWKVVEATSLDKTWEDRASGQTVCEAVIRAIRRSQIFTDDYDFLPRIAFIESNFGEKAYTFRDNYFGGIWQLNEEEFLYTQDDKWSAFHTKILNSFKIDWKIVQWVDLLKPMYSGLGARLYLQTITNSLPQTMVCVNPLTVVLNYEL